jgi:hypothetical protein
VGRRTVGRGFEDAARFATRDREVQREHIVAGGLQQSGGIQGTTPKVHAVGQNDGEMAYVSYLGFADKIRALGYTQRQKHNKIISTSHTHKRTTILF